MRSHGKSMERLPKSDAPCREHCYGAAQAWFVPSITQRFREEAALNLINNMLVLLTR